MSDDAAEAAWNEWAGSKVIAGETIYVKDCFLSGYRQALLDAADEQERLSTGPRALGSKAVQFKRMLFAQWLRERAVSNVVQNPPHPDAPIPTSLLASTGTERAEADLRARIAKLEAGDSSLKMQITKALARAHEAEHRLADRVDEVVAQRCEIGDLRARISALADMGDRMHGTVRTSDLRALCDRPAAAETKGET